jgi:hypothetical protein
MSKYNKPVSFKSTTTRPEVRLASLGCGIILFVISMFMLLLAVLIVIALIGGST